MQSRYSPILVGIILASLGASRGAAQSPDVPVRGNAVTPNAFQPALPCTLMLAPPGNRLRARGLTMFSDPIVVPTANGDFDYLPFGADDYFFDQVNVFFHAQRLLARFERYGLDLDEFPVYLHVQQGIGSFTHPTEAVTTIGTGEAGRNADAKDRDIIDHELTHAVFNPRMGTDPCPLDKGEAQPVAEGIADYFAFVVDGDTHMGEYASPPDGYHDIASDPAVYNYQRWDQLPGDPYSRGKVLNGALMELRAAIGETADELTFAALAHHPLRCMPCFADAMRWADGERYGGAHIAAIDSAFAHRGITGGPPSAAAIRGPQLVWKGEPAVFHLKAECGYGPLRYAWQWRPDVGASWIPLPDVADSVSLIPDSGAIELSATITDQRGAQLFADAQYPVGSQGQHVRGIHITGPAILTPGQRTTYGYVLDGGTGVPPFRTHWSVSGAVPFTNTDNVSTIDVVGISGALALVLQFSDAIGQVASDTFTAPIDLGSRRVTAITITGPAYLERGQTGRYGFSLQGGPGVNPVTHWTIVNGIFLGTHDAIDTVAALPNGLATLRVEYTDRAGQDVFGSLQIHIIDALATTIAGARLVAPGGPARFSAAPTGGVPPYVCQWLRIDPPDPTVGRSAPDTTAYADGPGVLVPSCRNPFVLQLAATDARGVTVTTTESISLIPTVGADAAAAPRVFRALGSVVAGTAVTFELPDDAGPGDLQLLDLAGRRIAALPIGDADHAAVTCSLPRPLGAGLYFARLVRAGRTRMTRFIVVPQ